MLYGLLDKKNIYKNQILTKQALAILGILGRFSTALMRSS